MPAPAPEQLLDFSLVILKRELKKLSRASKKTLDPLNPQLSKLLIEFTRALTAAAKESRFNRVTGEDIGRMTPDEQVELAGELFRQINKELRSKGMRMCLKTFKAIPLTDKELKEELEDSPEQEDLQ